MISLCTFYGNSRIFAACSSSGRQITFPAKNELTICFITGILFAEK
jgi:hypothetical protein